MKGFLSLITFVLLLPFVSHANVVGHMKDDGGELNQAWVLHDGLKIPFVAGSELSEGDWIITSKMGRVKLKLLDGSVIYIGNNSRLKLKSFSLNGKVLDKAHFDIHSGNVHLVPSENNPKQSRFLITTLTKQVKVGNTAFSMDVKPNYVTSNIGSTSVVQAGYTQPSQNSKGLIKSKVIQGSFVIDRPIVQFMVVRKNNNLKNLANRNANVPNHLNVNVPSLGNGAGSKAVIAAQKSLQRINNNVLIVNDVLVKAQASGVQAAKDAQAARDALAKIRAQVAANTLSATQAASAIDALNRVLAAARQAGSTAAQAVSKAQATLKNLNGAIQNIQGTLALVIQAANNARNAAQAAGGEVNTLLGSITTDATSVGANATSIGKDLTTVTDQTAAITGLATDANYVNTTEYHSSLMPQAAGISFFIDLKGVYQDSIDVATQKVTAANNAYILADNASSRSNGVLSTATDLVIQLQAKTAQAVTAAQSSSSSAALETSNNQEAYTQAQRLTAKARAAQIASDLALNNAQAAQTGADLAVVNIQTQVNQLLTTTAGVNVKKSAITQAKNASNAAQLKAIDVLGTQQAAKNAKGAYLAALKAESIAKIKSNASPLSSLAAQQAAKDSKSAQQQLITAQTSLQAAIDTNKLIKNGLISAKSQFDYAVAGKNTAVQTLNDYVNGTTSSPIVLQLRTDLRNVWDAEFTPAIGGMATVSQGQPSALQNALAQQKPPPKKKPPFRAGVAVP